MTTDELAAGRRVELEGTPNCRDLGGYRSSDGRRVRWGYLFRSGQLSQLTERDRDRLASLQLDVVIDLRREEEQDSDPSRLPDPPPAVESLPISPGSNDTFVSDAANWESASAGSLFDFMIDINRDFALGQQAAYRRLFERLLETPDCRMLFHCAAGKDRTGFAAAAILLVLGVPRETVMHDYLLTREFFHPHRELDRLRSKYQLEGHAPTFLPLLEAHPEYLGAALQALDEAYDDETAYFEEYLGLGPAELVELRRRYLE
jgi:protein-tyrosine phosphatase